jgi:aspartate dehydrogenase
MSSELQSSLKAELREIEVFNGSARDAVLLFPSNANIAAALAIGGVGFDKTTVSLLADPTSTKTEHTVEIASKIGTYRFEIINEISEENPKSSQLAAYSVLAELEIFAKAFGKSNRKTE